MNRTELANKVAERTGLNKKKAEEAVAAVFAEIIDAVKDGEKVQIVGFGGFEAKERAARTGHNPATGAVIQIAASKSPAFKAGKAFKDALN